MNEDGHTSSIRDKILTINVKPGWRSGTKITFPKEGDQGPNNIPGMLNSTRSKEQFIEMKNLYFLKELLVFVLYMLKN